jgi:hypothetical protein
MREGTMRPSYRYTSALGALLVALGSAGMALGGAETMVHSVVVGLGILLCTRGAEMSYQQGRDDELVNTLRAMRESKEHARTAEGVHRSEAPAAPVVAATRQDAVPEVADLR